MIYSTSLNAGVITKGGSKPNIIPELTELEFNIRAQRLKDMPQLGEKAVACFEAAGLATGCAVSTLTNYFANLLLYCTMFFSYSEP